MKNMPKIKNMVVLTLLLFISACGYQLRGSIELPKELESIYMQGGSRALKKTMQKTRKSSGGQLVDHIEQAEIIIKIEKENMDRRVLTLSSTGRVSEYELIYIVEFTLLDKAKEIISKQQRIEINRDYFNNQDEVLGKNNEERVIKEEMYRRAVRSIFYRSRVALEKLEK